MELYFLDDGSLVINKKTSIQLIDPDGFEVVRTIGSHQLTTGLTGKEVFDLLTKNGVQSSEESIRAGDREDKCPIRKDK